MGLTTQTGHSSGYKSTTSFIRHTDTELNKRVLGPSNRMDRHGSSIGLLSWSSSSTRHYSDTLNLPKTGFPSLAFPQVLSSPFRLKGNPSSLAVQLLALSPFLKMYLHHTVLLYFVQYIDYICTGNVIMPQNRRAIIRRIPCSDAPQLTTPRLHPTTSVKAAHPGRLPTLAHSTNMLRCCHTSKTQMLLGRRVPGKFFRFPQGPPLFKATASSFGDS